jgi:ribonuclease HIII
MPQKTIVMKIDPARATDLRRRLGEQSYEFRPVPYSLFSAKGEGVVATFYTSGKLVIQGDDPELFIERFLGRDALREATSERASGSTSGRVRAPTTDSKKSESRRAGSEERRTTTDPSRSDDGEAGDHVGPSRSRAHDGLESEAIVGSDECGKGDYFGPLVVAAVRLEAGDAERLRGGEVRDSKTLSDEACLRLGAALRGRFAHAIAELDPPRYNQTYQRKGQLNDMLADLHAEAITKLSRPGLRVLVDKFADESLLKRRLSSLGIRLEQRVRAESNAAVAAASIIARERFLTALKDLGDDHGVDLHKGAGAPVDESARRFVRIHGMEGLVRVAKLHFKNTQKIRDSR